MQEPSTPGQRPAGLFESMRALLATAIAMARDRLELFSVEIQTEVMRAVEVLLWGMAAVLAAALALAFFGLAVVAGFWDSHPVLAAVGVAAAFVILALLLMRAATAQLRARPRLFDASLTELEKDEAGLRSSR